MHLRPSVPRVERDAVSLRFAFIPGVLVFVELLVEEVEVEEAVTEEVVCENKGK